jgi:hypothetical protein
MSRALNLLLGRATRMARALASLSAGAMLPGSNTDSKHTIASLFKLRLCVSADAFSRWYTSSGIFFRVKVVATVRSIQSATIMVSHALAVKLLAHPSLKRTVTGMPGLAFISFWAELVLPAPAALEH